MPPRALLMFDISNATDDVENGCSKLQGGGCWNVCYSDTHNEFWIVKDHGAMDRFCCLQRVNRPCWTFFDTFAAGSWNCEVRGFSAWVCQSKELVITRIPRNSLKRGGGVQGAKVKICDEGPGNYGLQQQNSQPDLPPKQEVTITSNSTHWGSRGLGVDQMMEEWDDDYPHQTWTCNTVHAMYFHECYVLCQS